MKIQALKQIFLSSSPLLISADGYAQYMMEAFPPTSIPNPESRITIEDLLYKKEAKCALDILMKQYSLSDIPDVCITDEYDSNELPPSSIAYYRIFGFITADSYWYFSSKQFERDLLSAEKNDNISCHFLHINSPGGEAWYLDRLSETMRNLKKPVFALFEKLCCSAAIYIGCHAQNIQALTQNEQIGCIGTMTDFFSLEDYYKNLGIKHIKVKATQSPLKNKTVDDLIDGKPEKYRTDVLNPLAAQFIQEIRDNYSKIKDLPDDAPVLQGETFATQQAIEIGLVDGMMSFTEAIQAAVEMAKKYDSSLSNIRKALSYI
jgi:ClpP class serine protease